MIRRANELNVETTHPQEFEAIGGQGVIATVGSTQVLLGNGRLMEAHGVDINLQSKITELEAEGKTVMLLAVNNKLEGGIALADTVREEAVGVVA